VLLTAPPAVAVLVAVAELVAVAMLMVVAAAGPAVPSVVAAAVVAAAEPMIDPGAAAGPWGQAPEYPRRSRRILLVFPARPDGPECPPRIGNRPGVSTSPNRAVNPP
jgi:hypothetical protein